MSAHCARPWRRRGLVAGATLVASVAVPAQLAPPAAHAASTFYVATSGNDRNAGSSSAPKRTIAAAVNAARSGDTVIMRGGIYPESVQVYAKTLNLTSAPGERAILDGSKTV